MGVSKFFSGLNENAIKYLVPTWMSPMTGVFLRLGFGAIAFWVTGIFTRGKSTPTTLRARLLMFILGATTMFAYMTCLLQGLKYTTPISSAIFICLEPMVVFLIMAVFYGERVTGRKVLGILLGFAGAMIVILLQKKTKNAPDPLFGDLLCAGDCLAYSLYLIWSGQFLKKYDKITVSKWTFLGGASTSLPVALIVGWDASVFTSATFWLPILVLAFVLFIPTFVSYFLVDIGLQTLSTTVVALYGYVILVVTTIFSYIFGQDVFDWAQIVAMLLIVGSIYFVEVAERKERMTRRPATPSKKS